MSYRPFPLARNFVRILGLRSPEEWKKYCQLGLKPKDIPEFPEITYKKDWRGFDDFLGLAKNRNFLPFENAKLFVHSLGIQNQEQWKKYLKSNKKPANIPSNPKKAYGSLWISWDDWLGTKKDIDKLEITTNNLLDQAVDLLNEGNLKVGLHNLNKILSKEPNHILALYNKALAFVKNDRDKEALVIIKKLLKLNPEDHNALGLQADVLFNLNRLKSSLHIYLKLFKQNSSDINLVTSISDNYFFLRKPAKAMKFADLALRMNSKNPSALKAKVHALIDQYKTREAISFIRKWISVERNSAMAWFDLSLCLADLEYETDDVLDPLLVSVSLDPSYKKDMIPVFISRFKNYKDSPRFKRLIR